MELQLVIQFRSGRDMVSLYRVLVTFPCPGHRLTLTPGTSDESPMSAIDKRLNNVCFVELNKEAFFPRRRTSSIHRVKMTMTPSAD